MFKNAMAFGQKILFKIGQKSPEILLVAGVLGVATGFVLAAVKSSEVKQVVEETKEDFEDLKQAEESGEIRKKSKPLYVARIIGRFFIKFCKAMGPAVGIELAGIGFIVWSYSIKQKRYLGALSTIDLLSASFAEYRKRVREDAGDDKDFEYLTGAKKTIVKKIIQHDDGTTEEVESEEFVVDDESKKGYNNLYGRFFDEFNNPGGNWTKDPYSNSNFLQNVEKHATWVLKTRGWLFLNEVYAMLGYEPTWYGGIVGWLRDGELNGVPVTGEVSFRCKDIYSRYPTERSYFLDINCDGVIIDELRTRERVRETANKRMQEMVRKAWKQEVEGAHS